MLPGGIGVVGVFFICSPNEVSPASTRARQALFAIYKLLTKRQLLSTNRDQDSLEWSMMHVCRTTRKYPFCDPKTVKPALVTSCI